LSSPSAGLTGYASGLNPPPAKVRCSRGEEVVEKGHFMVKSQTWLTYALISALLYRLWGLFSKLATNYIDPKSAFIYDVLGSVLVALAVLVKTGFQLQVDSLGIFYGICTGISAMVATLFFLMAVSQGPVSIVGTITALYPTVTILLAFLILKEPISLRQAIGIGLAVAAIVLCAKN
jgi:transporter family protein